MLGSLTTSVGRRSRRSRFAGAALISSLLALLIAGAASADDGDIGHFGPSTDSGSARTGEKPQSKMWFNDGSWWASMWDASTSDNYIWRLNRSTHTWARTNTVLDVDTLTNADTLWTGGNLYVLSHGFSSSTSQDAHPVRLWRLSYNTSDDTYTVDSGFPVTIDDLEHEAVTLARDSTGQLWTAWEEGGKVWVNRSTTNDTTWGTPFTVPGSPTISTDDIASIVAFGGDKIGVMWSDQLNGRFQFAVHSDSAADDTWGSVETAASGPDVGDDHINLKTDSSGRVYAAVKTDSTSSSSMLIGLLVRQTNGGWSTHEVTNVTEGGTRPIVVIDEGNAVARVVYASAVSGGDIVEKTAPLSSISFPDGPGSVIMRDASHPNINDPTASKQNATAATGVVVLAYNNTVRGYWHADLGAPPPSAAPTAQAVTASVPIGAPKTLTLSGSDDDTCDLTFSIVAQPSHGTLGSITNSPCMVGTPNTDRATVTYTPAAGYSGPDSFTYRVSDGSLQSAAATATLNVSGSAPVTATFNAVADTHVKSTSPGSEYGSLTTMRTREDPGGDTYRSYVRFDVSGLTGTVTDVRLRLFIPSDPSPNTHSVYRTSSSWSEATLNWGNRPVESGSALVSSPVDATGVHEFQLSPSAVGGNGAVSFIIASSGTNSAFFETREGANDPQLLVTYQAAPTGPTAAFSGTPQTGTAPLTVAFTDQSTGSPTSWSWSFGDGGTSTTQSPSHTYAEPGSYTVQLTVSNASGSDVETGTSYVTVNPPPLTPATDFNATPVSGTAPLVVTFTDTSTNSPTTWAWDFGDGTTSAARNPSHTYSAAGTYTVTLTASNTAGSDTETKVGYVTVSAPPAPTAAFSGTPRTGTAPLVVAFADQSTGAPTSWSWTFGDGGTSTVRHPSHTYTTPGTYAVTLTATNGSGSDGETKNGYITVTEPGAEPVTQTFNAVADAYVRSKSATSNFGAATSLRAREASTDLYRSYLRFDVQGVAGTVTDVKLRLFMTDVSPNVHSVIPTATTWTETGAGSITWNNVPATTGGAVGAATLPTAGYVDVPLDSAAVGGNGLISFLIRSSDSNSAVFHSREAANDPQLVVTYQPGPPGPPTAAFGGTPRSGTAPLTVSFTDASTGSPTSWSWSFGDGATSTARNPSHTYTTPGTYTVTLTATNGSGSDVATKTGYVTVTQPETQRVTLAFNAVADAQVRSANTSSNYGTITSIRTRAPSDAYESYLRFDLSGISGAVTGVRLRLFVTDASPHTQSVLPTSATWGETTITWSNAPSATGAAVGAAAVPATGWVEIPLSADAVAGNGLVSFLLRSSGTNSAIFGSRESTTDPQLLVTVAP